MRIPSPFLHRRRGLELQLTPLIDCVFLLMIYFLWSSSFAAIELSLPGRIAAASGGSPSVAVPPPEADFDQVVVRVLWREGRPAWTVNGAEIASRADLRATLALFARLKREVPVVVHPAGDVPLGEAIDAFDLSRLAGFERIQMAAGQAD